MIKPLLYLTLALLLSACSTKTAPNKWQYESASSFDSYKTNFLSSKDALAKSDLNRALEHAKVSSDVKSLATIYLGECALNISVGQTSKCPKYEAIKDIVDDITLDAYFSLLISKLTSAQIQLLPKIYQNFVWHVESLEFKSANEDILNMEVVTSQLLAGALIKENLNNTTREKLLERASFYGYKKVVLFWLNELLQNTEEEKRKKEIAKKLLLLHSKE